MNIFAAVFLWLGRAVLGGLAALILTFLVCMVLGLTVSEGFGQAGWIFTFITVPLGAIGYPIWAWLRSPKITQPPRQQVSQGTPKAEPPGLGDRLLSAAIDTLLICLPAYLFLSARGEVRDWPFLVYSFVAAVCLLLPMWLFGQTSPGKMTFSLELVDGNTLQAPAWWKLLIRLGAVAAAVNFLTLFVDLLAVPVVLPLIYLNVQRDARGRSALDILSGTAVVRTGAGQPLKKGWLALLLGLVLAQVYVSIKNAGGGSAGASLEEMAEIPAGEFSMGSPLGVGFGGEWPVHRVFLDAYHIDKYEVTVARFKEYVAKTGASLPPQPDWNLDAHPVLNVDWDLAVGYCRWQGKRLPTEAEWEKAARGGEATTYSFGEEPDALGDYGWYKLNSGGQAHPVARKKPNQYGLYDMAGNATELVADSMSVRYYEDSPEKNPRGPLVLFNRKPLTRGGAYTDRAIDLRPAARHNTTLYYPGRDAKEGFRCAWSGKK